MEERRGEEMRANRCLFCPPFRYNRHIPKTAAIITVRPPLRTECPMLSPRGLEHSSKRGGRRRRKKKKKVTTRQTWHMATWATKPKVVCHREKEERGAISETGPDHDFGFGAVRG